VHDFVAADGSRLRQLVSMVMIVRHAGDERPDPPRLLQKPDQRVLNLFSERGGPRKGPRRALPGSVLSSAMMRTTRPMVFSMDGRKLENGYGWKPAVMAAGPSPEPIMLHGSAPARRRTARDENIVNATRAGATPPVLPNVATYPSRAPPGQAYDDCSDRSPHRCPPCLRCWR